MHAYSNSTAEYGYYTKTGRTVNTIKNGLPQMKEAVSVKAGSLERFDFMDHLQISCSEIG
jgi:hypothetical protein